MILDLFAGAGGADEGLRLLGVTDVLGIEWDTDACATAGAAGHKRVQADVSQLYPHDYPCDGLWVSPPCQAWSMAGKRTAQADQERLLRHVMQCREGWKPYDASDYADERTPLVLEPLRWIDALRPRWVAFEQVPPVLGFWKACAYVLREWGYWTWTGVLNSADHGVPQTRQRAFLVADQDGPVGPPEQTHAETPTGELEPWVTMAQALGWEASMNGGGRAHSAVRTPDEPAPTLAFGNNASKFTLHSRRDSPKWVDEHGERPNRTDDEPAPTISGEAHRWVWERPATTVVGSFSPGTIAAPGYRNAGDGPRQDAPGSVRVAVWQAAVLQGFPPDYPWRGSKTSQFAQCGNAVPPPLAAAVCKRLLARSSDREEVIAEQPASIR